MAHYVMGDIHGEADRFHAMLKKIQFSEDDILILLGDVISGSIRLIEAVMLAASLALGIMAAIILMQGVIF